MINKIKIMDYKKHYDLLISTRKNRTIIKDQYYEKHHIIPKSHGGNNDKDNLIFLTAREHFIAHWFLWRIHRDSKMAFAFYLMSYGIRNGRFSSIAYEEAKHARSKFISESNKIHKTGYIKSEETRKKLSQSLKNLKKSEIHKQKISESLKKLSKTKEHREKISKSLKNFDWSSYTERNKNISIKNTGSLNGKARIVNQYNENYELINTFLTMKEALIYINTISDKNIYKTTFFRYIVKGQLLSNFYWCFE